MVPGWRIYFMLSCFTIFFPQSVQVLKFPNAEQLSSSGEMPLDDPPTFVVSSFGYKPDETSPEPPLILEVTVGDPAVPGLDLTGFEYQVTWFAKGEKTARVQRVWRQLISRGNDVTDKLGFKQSGKKGYRLGEKIYAKFKVRYYRLDVIDSSIVDYSPWSETVSSPAYQTGIVVDPAGDIPLKECNGSYSKLTLILKTPINCPANSDNCLLGITLFFERIPGSLYYWTSRQEVALSVCHITLNNDNLNKRFDVYLKAVCDSVEDGNDDILLRFEFVQTTFFWSSYNIQDKKIKISDTLTRWCTYQGDPHMKTFDGLSYSFFGIGDYLLYKHEEMRLEINARLWPCASRASCICGIAIQEGNAVLILKGCNIKKPWKFGVTFETAASSSVSAIKVLKEISSNNKFSIFLANGAHLIVTHTYNPDADKSWVNIMLRVPGEGGVHLGMCGNFDRIARNDLSYGGDGRNYTGNPNGFGESWSLAFNEDSWFRKSPTFVEVDQREMCSCGTRAGWWSETKPRLATRCGYTEENHFIIISRDYVDITGSLRANARTRRATGDLGNADVFVEGSESDGEFNVKDFTDFKPVETLSWPTASGLTRVEVNGYCRGIIFGSSGADQCQKTQAKTSIGNSSDLVDSCIKDVQITDEKFWSSSALSTFQLQCDEAIIVEHIKTVANETDTIQDDGTQATAELLVLAPKEVVLTCPGDCTGNGSCIKGDCVCNKGRTGIDCSMKTDQVPVLKDIYSNGLCDIRARACKTTRVNGFGFMNLQGGSLTCHVTGFEVFNNSWNESGYQVPTAAQLIDLYQVQCKLLPHPVTRDKNPYASGTPAVGMEITVSNDGKRASNKQLLVVYDGLCLDCDNSGNCHTKNSTCLINGRCYAEGEVHTGDKSKSCQPDVSTDQWTEDKHVSPKEESRDTTIIIAAGVIAPLALLILVGVIVRCWIFGGRSGGVELDQTREDTSDLYFHY